MTKLFDYTNQAWTQDGAYVDCGHPAAGCECYGRAHAGEAVSEEVMHEMDEREGNVLKHRRDYIALLSGARAP